VISGHHGRERAAHHRGDDRPACATAQRRSRPASRFTGHPQDSYDALHGRFDGSSSLLARPHLRQGDGWIRPSGRSILDIDPAESTHDGRSPRPPAPSPLSHLDRQLPITVPGGSAQLSPPAILPRLGCDMRPLPERRPTCRLGRDVPGQNRTRVPASASLATAQRRALVKNDCASNAPWAAISAKEGQLLPQASVPSACVTGRGPQKKPSAPSPSILNAISHDSGRHQHQDLGRQTTRSPSNENQSQAISFPSLTKSALYSQEKSPTHPPKAEWDTPKTVSFLLGALATNQSIISLCGNMDCFAEACHRGGISATVAPMTEKTSPSDDDTDEFGLTTDIFTRSPRAPRPPVFRRQKPAFRRRRIIQTIAQPVRSMPACIDQS